jgi:hypothetical protein
MWLMAADADTNCLDLFHAIPLKLKGISVALISLLELDDEDELLIDDSDDSLLKDDEEDESVILSVYCAIYLRLMMKNVHKECF